jgi:ribulose-phosphate 3-epimerase
MTGSIAPSVLSADFKCLGMQLKELEDAGIRRIHIDVMDGMFVPNLSIGFPVIRSIRSCTGMEFDVHLMVEEPEKFISVAADAGADSITVHQESCRHLSRTIHQIKESGCRAGVALNPATTAETLKYVVQDLDQVLLMTVNPGFGGQKFLPAMMEKIKEIRMFFQQMGCSPALELDGGITAENAKACVLNGANILVAGSAVFRGNIQENVRKLLEEISLPEPS